MTTGPGASSVRVEAALLAEACAAWVAGHTGQPTTGTPDGPTGPAGAANPPGAPCVGCPVCQARSLLRLLPPGTWEHLAAAAVELRSALTAATAPRPGDGPRPSGNGGGDRTERVPVQHIPVRD